MLMLTAGAVPAIRGSCAAQEGLLATMCDAKTNKMPRLSIIEEVMRGIPAVVLPVLGELTQQSENPKSVVGTIGITPFESAM
jgi:hypothetical protein